MSKESLQSMYLEAVEELELLRKAEKERNALARALANARLVSKGGPPFFCEHCGTYIQKKGHAPGCEVEIAQRVLNDIKDASNAMPEDKALRALGFFADRFLTNAVARTYASQEEEKQRAFISRVAVRFRNVLYSLPRPARHHNVLNLIADQLDESDITGEQGFLHPITGRFMNREEAAKYALTIDQVQTLSAPPLLYSEDLW